VDVAKVLKDAWQAVQDSGVPKELQETAFNRAVDLYGGAPAGQPPIVLPTPPASPGTATSPAGHTGNDENVFYDQLASATKVSRQRLESLVHLEDGEPRMAIHTSKLPKGKKPGQLFIARVILTSRYVALGETEVPLAVVRSECDRYGVQDGNFAANMKTLSGTGITISGSGKSQKAKVRQSYIDGFAQWVTGTLGGESSASA
jgi:hypothetical protein